MLDIQGLYNQKIHVLSEIDKTIACSIDKAQKELEYKPKFSLRGNEKIYLLGARK